MVRVEWLKTALEDVDAIKAYLERFDPDVADRYAARFLALAETLSEFPKRGRPIGNALRERAVVPRYLLRYRVTGDRVEIVEVRHSARYRP